MVHCATPVLAFGRWQDAEVTTVGINPSKFEFLDKDRPLNQAGWDFAELVVDERRFLHRRANYTEDLTQEMVRDARDLAERYFERGKEYVGWFRGFGPLLGALESRFNTGLSCHTDYLSPFATSRKPLPKDVKSRLCAHGLACWVEVLKCMTNLRVVIGLGAGWKNLDASIFSGWQSCDFLSDRERIAHYQFPYLKAGQLQLNQLTIPVFWWVPHRGDPLFGLSNSEKERLGEYIRSRL